MPRITFQPAREWWSKLKREHYTLNDDMTLEWDEVDNTEPGLVRRRHVTASAWVIERTDCYCCSCPDWGSSDPYCRNHGFGFGERPCETHNMPGSNMVEPDTLEDTGTMPASVQVKRKDNRDG